MTEEQIKERKEHIMDVAERIYKMTKDLTKLMDEPFNPVQAKKVAGLSEEEKEELDNQKILDADEIIKDKEYEN